VFFGNVLQANVGQVVITALFQKTPSSYSPVVLPGLQKSKEMYSTLLQAPSTQAALLAGIPNTCPCTTINKVGIISAYPSQTEGNTLFTFFSSGTFSLFNVESGFSLRSIF
jgi:hypothetical protein